MRKIMIVSAFVSTTLASSCAIKDLEPGEEAAYVSQSMLVCGCSHAVQLRISYRQRRHIESVTPTVWPTTAILTEFLLTKDCACSIIIRYSGSALAFAQLTLLVPLMLAW